MGKQTKGVVRNRMSQKKLDSLIVNKTPVVEVVEREHVEPHPILTSNEEYDTLHPEETIREFCGSARDMLSRYNGNKEQLNKLESQMQDLLHYIEMSKDKNANDGYKLYKRLCEVRRERRAIKNEIDLLEPVYNLFHDNGIINQLERAQGGCRTAKQIICNKGYSVRTDVLDGLL